MFTDIEGSVRLANQLGIERYAEILKRHGALFREALGAVKTGHLEKHTGDGYMARFGRPSDAVAVALRFQWSIMREPWGADCALRVRIGIHQGEILLISTEHEGPASVGAPQNLAARVMAMAEGGQVLLTRAVFDDARQFIKKIPEIPADAQSELGWEAHGSYLIKGLDDAVEIFEVGERGRASFRQPENGPNATRSVSAEEEATLGWRPAKEMEVPKRVGWFLRERLGEGGFGEVWLAENRRTPEVRVFKFCFDVVRLRTFKREVALFRLICERLGKRRDIATLYEAQLNTAPFFLESEYCPGGTLRQWLEANPSPLPVRLGIVARVARALHAAHSAGIIHKDVKPSNIFMETREDGTPWPRLADFGIGVVQDPAALAGLDLTFTVQPGGADDLSRTGTRIYNAPEYMMGREPSIQGDIYSLGVLLYHVAIGNFEKPLGEGWQRDVPDALLAEDITACVEADPARRLGSAEELAVRLETLERRRGDRERLRRRAGFRRRAKVALAMAAIAAALAGGARVVRDRLQRADATAKARTAEVAAEREVASRRRYLSDLQTVRDDLDQNRVEAARKTLDRHRPQPGDRDWRGWEWYLADSRLSTGQVRTVSERPLRALAVSPDTQRAAIGGDAGEITIWSCDALGKIATWKIGDSAVRCLGWSGAGVIAAGLANGEVTLRDAATGRELKHWWANEGAVTALDWHHDSDGLFTGGENGALARWDSEGHAQWQVRREAPIQALAWRAEDSQLAAIFGRPASLVVAQEHDIGGHHEYDLVTQESALAWRPGFYEVAIAMKGVPMSSWNPYSCVDSFSLENRASPGASAYAWSPGGDGVAVGGIDGAIHIVEPYRAGDPRAPLGGHKGRVTGLHWLAGKTERLLSIGEDGTLRAWDDLRRSSEAEGIRFATILADARWHPSENQFAVMLAGDEVQIVDGATWKTRWSRPLPQPLGGRTTFTTGRLAWSPDGQWLAAACPGRAFIAWRIASGETFAPPGLMNVSDIEWLPDSRRMLLRTARGWSSLELGGGRSTEISGTEKAVWIGALDAHRRGIVVAESGAARFFTTDLNGGAPHPVAALPDDLGPIRKCGLNKDRTLLAILGENGAVLWIDTRTGKCARPGVAHTGPALALAWQPDGSRLATVGADGTCRIFNLALGEQNWVIEPKFKPPIVAVDWSADGQRLLVASSPDKRVKVYDASRSWDREKRVTTAPPRADFPARLAQAFDGIERHPGEEFGWSALAQAVRESRGESANPEADALLAAARLGIEARFSPLDPATTPLAMAAAWKDAPLPSAVQLAEASALGQWDHALALGVRAPAGDGPAAWFALARAEALARLGRRVDAESANFEAWRALRRHHGGEDAVPDRISGSTTGEGVDLTPWANVKLSEDWAGGQNNNLASLPSVLGLPDGSSFHCRDFILLSGKSLRLTAGRMLPRSTGWIPLDRPGSEVSFLVGACYVDVDEHLQDHCIGSLFLLRKGGAEAVRIPLIYGRNVWDWWTPSSGHLKEATDEAIAWTGENPNATYNRHGLKLYRIRWEAGPGEPAVVAISIASHLRRPAPMLMAAEVVR